MSNAIRFLKIFAMIFLSHVDGFVHHSLYLEEYSTQSIDIGKNEIKNILQPVDHFDDKDTRTWNMPYIQNLEFWKPNGPIFINMGGAYPYIVQTHIFKEGYFLYDLVKETNGALFGAEHRYYGSTKPMNNTKTENLKYLNSQQALADVATLIKYVKTLLNAEDSKVVVVGGTVKGNAGNLAAWMRLLYSDIVDAAVSDSGPVLAKADFKDFFEVIGEDFLKYGTKGCYNKISKMFTRYETLFRTPEGTKQVKKEQHICDSVDMSRIENQQVFFSVYYYSFILMANIANDDFFFKLQCEKSFNDTRLEPILLHLKRESSVRDAEDWCLNVDFDYIFNREDKNCWFYQQCTEFGSFPSTELGKHPFSNSLPVEFYYKACKLQFGPEFGKNRVESGVKATNKMYGGLQPNVTKVAFINGGFNPSWKLGITESLSDDAPAFFIEKASRAQLLGYPDKENQCKEVNEVKNRVKALIKKWIGL